nr:Chain C, C-terminal derived peptide of guanine nucleotide-binding protein G(t) subunit alpha-1 [Bos taurus]
VLEDLKSCGLF